MATVPYSPVIDQTLQGAAPQVSVPANPDAFGVNVARATENLGKGIESDSNELFARALQIQNLNNETEAKEADSRYMIKAGELHANYSALEGKAAVDAYPKYAADLQSARQDMRNGLSNPMAQKLYDSSSLSTMGRSIFNGAGHAATQQKAYVVNTATANMELDANTVADNPKDEGLFQQRLQRTRENAETVAAAKGAGIGDPQSQALAQDATSKLWANRIIGLSRQNPFEAARYLDDHKTELTETDFLKVDNTVRANGRAVGSQNIANEVFNAGKGDDNTPPKSLSEMQAEARAKAKEQDPNDPLLETHTVAALNGIVNQQRYAKKQEDYDNQQTVDGAIAKGVKTEQQLRADPAVASAIDALPKDKRLNIPQRINSFNAAHDKVANEDRFNTLMGMSNNDVEGFLNTDVLGDKQLNQSQMTQLAKRQQTLKAQATQDPRVDRALGWMRGAMGSQMEALGVYRRTTSNKDDYDHLTGTVQSALDIWQENHGKPPTYKEFSEQIAPQVIQQRSEPGMLWGTNKKPFFNQETPSDFSEKVKADVIAKGGVEPTEEQLNRAYIRTQLIKLYPSGKATQ